MAGKRTRSKKLRLPIPSQRDTEIYLKWQQVSRLVQASRASGHPTAGNDALSQLIVADPQGVLAPFFQLWLVDNHMLAGELRPAISAYREVHARYRERRFCGEAIGAIALQSAAHAHARLGEVPQAMEALAEAADSYSGACYPLAWHISAVVCLNGQGSIRRL